MKLCQVLMMKASSVQQGRLPVLPRWVRALYAVQCYARGTSPQLLPAAREQQALPMLLRWVSLTHTSSVLYETSLRLRSIKLPSTAMWDREA